MKLKVGMKIKVHVIPSSGKLRTVIRTVRSWLEGLFIWYNDNEYWENELTYNAEHDWYEIKEKV